MKILYVIGFFYPSQAGGPSSAISWLVKFVHKQGVETKVVTTNYDVKDKSIEPDMWINNEFGSVIYHSYQSLQLPVKMTLTAIQELKNIDIVHLNSIFHPPSLVIAIFALLKKKVIFWDPGGELAQEALKYGKVKKWLYLKLVKFVVGSHPYYHTTSRQETNDVKSQICKNAKFFEAPNYIEEIEKNECEVKKQILFIGRLHPIKGIDNLLKSVSISSKFMDSEFSLVIAGDYENDYGIFLKKMVNDLGLDMKVRFVGHVTDKDKFILYAESYFLVLPSHSENFANVVTESLSQGTPVIASKGTPWQCLEDYGAGFYSSNDPDILAETINCALSLDHEVYLNFRKNAHNLLVQEFSMEKGVHKWLIAYQSAMIDMS